MDQKRNNGGLPASLLVLNNSSKSFCKLQPTDLQVTCNREQTFGALWAFMPDTPRICGPSCCNNSLLVALAMDKPVRRQQITGRGGFIQQNSLFPPKMVRMLLFNWCKLTICWLCKYIINLQMTASKQRNLSSNGILIIKMLPVKVKLAKIKRRTWTDSKAIIFPFHSVLC